VSEDRSDEVARTGAIGGLVTVERVDPPASADEKTMLSAFLDYHRDTLRWKCDGLTPEQLIRQASPPSTLRLLGLVRHLTEVEEGWFTHHFAGGPPAPAYSTDDDPDGDLNVTSADEESVAAAWALYDEAVERSRALITASDLDTMAAGTTKRGEQYSLRWIMLHMIEEYARHNGHADLLREAIDGATGE
jgi:uncharacterized damage-inducible protein DinB